MILDEPTVLPEGTILDLVVDDEGDNLTPEERKALHVALRRADASLAKGHGRSADELIAALRSK